MAGEAEIDRMRHIGNARRGYKHTEEAKARIGRANAIALRGRPGTKHSQATKNKLSDAHRGKILSEEHKEKIRQSLIGKTIGSEVRSKISAAVKAQWVKRKGAHYASS